MGWNYCWGLGIVDANILPNFNVSPIRQVYSLHLNGRTMFYMVENCGGEKMI